MGGVSGDLVGLVACIARLRACTITIVQVYVDLVNRLAEEIFEGHRSGLAERGPEAEQCLFSSGSRGANPERLQCRGVESTAVAPASYGSQTCAD